MIPLSRHQKTAMKYQPPKLITGGQHATFSTYLAPSTNHTIEIIRNRLVGKSAHNDYTPNKATVKDKEGKFVFLPRKVKRSAGSIAKWLFEQQSVLENVPAVPAIKIKKHLESINAINSTNIDAPSLENWRMMWRETDSLRSFIADQIGKIDPAP
jgi:hypothetical protein